MYIYGMYIILIMQQAQNKMDSGLIAWESLSLDELRSMDEQMKNLCNERRKEPGRDYPLTDEERNHWDIIRFFQNKKENEGESISIGDLFYTSWGYDQTNTEHFKVIKISPSGKTCEVVQVGTRSVPGTQGFMSDQVKPDPDVLIVSEPCRVKLSRSSSWNPITQKHEEIGEIHLRGSVWYANGNGKHLQNLYRCKGSNYRSWYA